MTHLSHCVAPWVFAVLNLKCLLSLTLKCDWRQRDWRQRGFSLASSHKTCVRVCCALHRRAIITKEGFWYLAQENLVITANLQRPWHLSDISTGIFGFNSFTWTAIFKVCDAVPWRRQYVPSDSDCQGLYRMMSLLLTLTVSTVSLCGYEMNLNVLVTINRIIVYSSLVFAFQPSFLAH